MNNILSFMRRERLYVLLLAFVILLNIAGSVNTVKKANPVNVKAAAGSKRETGSLFVKSDEIESVLEKNKKLAVIYNLSSLLIFFILLLGIAVDIILSSHIAGKRELLVPTYKPHRVMWDTWDVARVVILFLFFGYMIVMAESALVKLLPFLKNQNFRMIINSSALDVLSIVFIIYFTVGQYQEKLSSLGISAKNFFRNVFYGLVGYVAIIPVLVAILIFTAVFTRLIGYVPEKQIVVEMFLKEKNTFFLLYTSLFAAVAGPIIEELFFRGFMYNAFKKYMNRAAAMCVTAALFSALHAHPVGFLPIMVLGIMLAYMYEKTGTLVSSITIHTLHNLGMVGLVFLAKGMRA